MREANERTTSWIKQINVSDWGTPGFVVTAIGEKRREEPRSPVSQ